LANTRRACAPEHRSWCAHRAIAWCKALILFTCLLTDKRPLLSPAQLPLRSCATIGTCLSPRKSSVHRCYGSNARDVHIGERAGAVPARFAGQSAFKPCMGVHMLRSLVLRPRFRFPTELKHKLDLSQGPPRNKVPGMIWWFALAALLLASAALGDGADGTRMLDQGEPAGFR
jgi:hypothetical protein